MNLEQWQQLVYLTEEYGSATWVMGRRQCTCGYAELVAALAAKEELKMCSLEQGFYQTGGTEMTAKQTPLVDLLRIHADDIHSAHGHNKSSTLLSQAADRIDALEAELAECKWDAERYRWVRQRLEVRMMANMRGGSAAALATRVGHAFFHSSVSPAPIKAERLDAAIDAALAAEGEK